MHSVPTSSQRKSKLDVGHVPLKSMGESTISLCFNRSFSRWMGESPLGRRKISLCSRDRSKTVLYRFGGTASSRCAPTTFGLEHLSRFAGREKRCSSMTRANAVREPRWPSPHLDGSRHRAFPCVDAVTAPSTEAQ